MYNFLRNKNQRPLFTKIEIRNNYNEINVRTEYEVDKNIYQILNTANDSKYQYRKPYTKYPNFKTPNINIKLYLYKEK